MAWEFCSRREEFDDDRVTELLRTSYWASTRPVEEQSRAMDHSLNFGIRSDGRLVGYARVVTDYCTFAWICDVIVDEDWRGQGVGKALMDHLFSHESLATCRRFLLTTKDAHELYRRYGFEEAESNRVMLKGFAKLSEW